MTDVVRRAEFLEPEVVGDRCELRLVWRKAPMRVKLDRAQARRLVEQLERFAFGDEVTS